MTIWNGSQPSRAGNRREYVGVITNELGASCGSWQSPAPINVEDSEAPPQPTDGSSCGCVIATPELIKEIMRSPEEDDVNVHNTAFSSGAIRGQLGTK